MWNYKASSKICSEKNSISNHLRHISNIVSAKPRIDTKTPYQPQFMKNRAKQRKTMQDKNQKIQQENQLLLDKMMRIEKKPGQLNQQVISATYRKEHQHGNTQLRALNMKKINEQNKKMLGRLSNTTATYKKQEWIKDAYKNEEYLGNISRNARRNTHTNYGDFKNLNNSKSFGQFNTFQNSGTSFYKQQKQREYNYDINDQVNNNEQYNSNNNQTQNQRQSRPFTANQQQRAQMARPNTSNAQFRNYREQGQFN